MAIDKRKINSAAVTWQDTGHFANCACYVRQIFHMGAHYDRKKEHQLTPNSLFSESKRNKYFFTDKEH